MGNYPKDVAPLIEQGVAANQAGQIEAARQYFEEAAKLNPKNSEVLLQLGIIAIRTANSGDSLTYLERAKKLNPGDPRIHYSLGVAYNSTQDTAKAVSAYEKALRLKPDYAKASLNLGSVYVQQGRMDSAIDVYRRALRYDAAHYAIFTRLASLFESQKRWKDLRAISKDALNTQPGFTEGFICMGRALTGEKDIQTALCYFQGGVENDPNNALAHYSLAQCLHTINQYENAISHYETAYKLDSKLSASALVCIAEIYEKQGNLEMAEAFAMRALEIEPSHPAGNRIIATVLRQKGEFTVALERLLSVEIPENDALIASSIHNELGKLFDLTGHPNQAISHFSQCNSYLEFLFPMAERDRLETNALGDKLLAAFKPGKFTSWINVALPEAGQRIAFLVGFPRSGTTLLDQLLDAHPRIQVVEERPMVSETRARITEDYPNYPYNLAEFRSEDLVRYQNIYMSLIGQYISVNSETALIIDKMPLNIRHVGLIYRLFPAAKIILALRHPCDACLSCFMQFFTHNINMANFYNLDDTTAFYEKVMRLWTYYEDIFDLDLVVTRYEDLVADLQGNAARLLDALGVEWDPAVLRFDEHARRRELIRTPSYNQVTRPIYREAVYRWHKYREHLSPYMDRLAPYIERFGYDA